MKEIRLVTKETETIKAQIDSDLWTRQRRWEQKKESYAGLLKSAAEIRDWCYNAIAANAAAAIPGANMRPPWAEPAELVRMERVFRKRRIVSRMFLSIEAVAALQRYE